MATWRILIGFAALVSAVLGTPVARAEGTVEQVYLIQNSGWMEPFLVDANRPAFLAKIAAFVKGTAADGDPIIIADFNQEGQLDRGSPHVLYEGAADAARIEAAVRSVDLPRRDSDGAFTDADFDGALENAVSGLLKRRPGLIWLITNNKSSKDNSQDYENNTTRFNQSLSEQPYLSRIVAFPIPHPVIGKLYPGKPGPYHESGFIIYGIAYDSPDSPVAAQQLREISARPALLADFERSGLLKPLEQSALTFEAQRMRIDGEEYPPPVPGQRLVLEHLPGGRPITVQLEGRLYSNYYPQVIQQAAASLTWRTDPESHQDLAIVASITPTVIPRIPPDEDLKGAVLTLQIPPIERPAGLAGYLDPRLQVDGALFLKLTNLDLTTLEEFDGRLAQVAAGQNLLPIFLAYRDVHEATTPIPVTLNATFSSWPLIAALGAGATLLLLGLGAAAYMARPQSHSVMLGPDRRNVRVRPLQKLEVPWPSDPQRRARVQGRLFGSPKVTDVAGSGVTPGRTW